MPRFLVINDLHAQWNGTIAAHPGYPGATIRADWLLDELARPGAFGGLDFVLSAGDLIHGESLDAIASQIAALGKRLTALPLLIHPGVGNHEIQQAEGDPAYEAPYRKAFGDRLDYLLPAGPVDLVVLCNAGCFHVTRERREARYRFLRNALRITPTRPKILVCHVPLIPLRDPDVLRESFGFISYYCLDSELLDLLDEHGQSVRLVISGHLHLTGMVERRGVRHLATAGTASFPHDILLVDIEPNQIAVEVMSLPAALHAPSSTIHGRPRYTHDFTDPNHPDHATYLRGTPAERRFSIPL